MQMLLRLAIAVPAIFLLLLGSAFLAVPGQVMEPLGLIAEKAMGLNFIHGDVGASLMLIGGLIGRAALAGDGLKLNIPLVWVMLLLVGRIIGMATDPNGLEAAPLFVVDFSLLLLLLLGRGKMKRAV